MDGTGLKQRLTAILAADAVGYSRLMAVDDRSTVAALDSARAMFRTRIESNRGRVVDMAGDAVLAVSRHRSCGERCAEVDAQPVRHHRDSLAIDW